MAPRKRQRRGAEHESDEAGSSPEEQDVETGSRSALKKPRISEIQAGPKTKMARKSTAVEDADGLASGEDTDDDEGKLYEQLTQRMESSKHGQIINQPALYGTVLSVTLENFMCHQLLTMDFGPFMNFVVGQNGSGKSAVLTALTICLGASAAATNRGANIKSFIKEGEEQAIITVRLRNGGDGYKTDIYGDVIVIERSFNRTGGGGYKIKSKSKKTISTKKEELVEITDFLGLQIDNPMTVLSQDMARQFLSTSTNEDKYRFFMQGVQLDQLKGDYDILEDASDKIQATLSSKNEDIKDLQEEARIAREKVEASRQAGEIYEQLDISTKRLVWAHVAEVEKTLGDHDKEVEKAETKLVRLREAFEQAGVKLQIATQAVEDAKSAQEEAAEALNPLKEEKKEVHAEFDAAKANVHSELENEREAYAQIKDANKKIDKVNRDIAVERKRLEQLDDGQNAQTLQEKETKIAKSEALKTELEKLQTDNANSARNKQNARDIHEELANRVAAKKTEIDQCETLIKNIEQSSKQAWAAFGANTENLVSAINRQQWRGQKPIGPFGKYVKLKDPKWSLILEKQLGGLLNAFLCSTEDKAALARLMQQQSCQVPILTGRGAPLTQLHEPPNEYSTVLRILEISDDNIKKALIISSYIEQTLLIEDHNEATRIMAQPPSNTKNCYALQNKKGWGLVVKGGRNSGSMTPIEPYNKVPRMTTDMTSQLASARQRLLQLEEELQALSQQEREAITNRRQIQTAIDTFIKSQQDINRQLQRLDDDIERLTHSLEDSLVPNGKMADLEARLATQLEAKQTYESQYQEVINSKDRTSAEMTRVSAKMAELNTRIDEAQRVLVTHHDAIQKATQRREQALSDKNLREKQIQGKMQEIADKKTERGALEEVLQEKTDFAHEMEPERPELARGETTASLEKKTNELHVKLNQAEKRSGGDITTLARDYTVKQDKATAAAKEMESLNAMLTIVKTTWRERVKRWDYFKKHIVARARIVFQIYMSEREYNGDLQFNHEMKTLALVVQPSQQVTDTKRGAKTLSGGEKSFSQICLLLALWEAMGSPFRCLDEFDVFMDAVNRGVSMTLIINAAQKSIGKQFILITPQDVSTKAIDSRNDVKIVRMKNPERKQAALPFGR